MVTFGRISEELVRTYFGVSEEDFETHSTRTEQL
ncbi:unnamed protein product [Arabidopsis halleri]